MSKADNLAAAIAARLGTIRIANGYATDAGQHVFRGARSIGEDDVPCIVLYEPEDEIADQKEGKTTGRLPFEIEGQVACDPANPNVAAHTLVADIKRCIFGGDLEWNKLATGTTYLGRTINDRAAGTAVVYATVRIRCGFVENLANP